MREKKEVKKEGNSRNSMKMRKVNESKNKGKKIKEKNKGNTKVKNRTETT